MQGRRGESLDMLNLQNVQFDWKDVGEGLVLYVYDEKSKKLLGHVIME